ncbi:MAG: SWEET family sugar transporter [Candidatus Magasanikbacteria bacterium]|nr:SWEET family sugar transporter [Candidatus Magasanikbacteria bacterium]
MHKRLFSDKFKLSSFTKREEKVVELLGIFGAITSTMIVLVGLPSQIWQTHKTKSVEGLSVLLVIFVGLSYLSWTFYSLLKPDWFLFAGQAGGSVFGLVFFCQFVYYKIFYKKRKQKGDKNA